MIQEIVIPFEVTPASRPYVTKYKVFYSKNYTAFRSVVGDWLKKQNVIKFSGAIRVDINFYFKVKKSWSKKKKTQAIIEEYHIQNNDIDNCIKSCLDLMNGIAYDDDKQVAELRAVKKWSEEGSIKIRFEEIGGEKK